MNMSFCKLTRYSLNKLLLCNIKLFSRYDRFYSVKNGKLFAERMKDKCLVLLKGKDSSSLLQGLITNDINHLISESEAIYSMFLNNRGRVMFDTIIAKGKEDESFFLECDLSAVRTLEKHLKKFKLRKKVSLQVYEDEYSIYSVFCLKDVLNSLPEDLVSLINKDEELKTFFNGSEGNLSIDNLNFGNLLAYRDPRLSALGYRVILPKESLMKEVNSNFIDPGNTELHKLCRYWLGIAEGKEEIPYEQCFPLESNCDYLHGVSFQKGCYIGQELTARSHHTGVIRKRIMPLVFDKTTEILPPDITADETETSKKVGKLRAHTGKYGVGLLRTAECLKLPNLYIGGITARCFKPIWWPQENQKLNKQEVT